MEPLSLISPLITLKLNTKDISHCLLYFYLDSSMLPVFSVILEYRKDGRNSSARPAVRPQFLCCMCILHSRHFKANPNTFIFKPYQLQLITEHAFRRTKMLN